MQRISFLINTSINTLDHVKLLMKSLKENLREKTHEIIVFVDSDNEGTVDYLRKIRQEFFDLKIITHNVIPCIGYSRNNNILVELSKYDIVSYLQSDMVISKDYDVNVLSELEDNCILSSTRIEPPLHGISDKTITKDFGVDPNDFKWEEFLQFSEQQKQNKELEYFFAPFTFYKKVWLDVGGYDTLYRRSREDSDLLLRLIKKGVKIKQTFKANVYHFSCVTSRGKNWFNQENEKAQDRVKLQSYADQIELRRFVKKWGNFNHGEYSLEKYDCDLVIKGSDEYHVATTAYKLEPYFSRVWITYESGIDRLLNAHRHDHDPANELLNFSKENWENYKKYYNQIDYSKIYLLGEPEKYSAKIELNLDSQESNFLSDNTLANLSELIKQTEPGDYESGNCNISIREAKNITPSFKVENPPFDMSLLNIE